MRDEKEIPPSALLTAAYALNRLRLRTDIAVTDKIMLDHFKTMKKDDPGYYSWEYILRDRKERNFNGIASNFSFDITTHEELVLSGPWSKYVPPAVRKDIKMVCATHTPKDDREAWMFRLGKDLRCESDDIPEGAKLDAKTGIGFQTITLEGDVLEIARTPKKEDIYVELEISSWKGISLGAEHYYVKLKLYNWSPSLMVVKAGKGSDQVAGKFYNMSGHGDTTKPRMCRYGDIRVRRPLTKADLKETKARFNEDRYKGYEIGAMIDGFWTMKDAIAQGKALYSRLFDEKSVALKIDDGT